MPHSSLFGRLLARIRHHAGLSQQELSSFLHIDRSTLSRLETGRHPPPRDPAFYEHLATVPGFTHRAVLLLRDAGEVNELLADFPTRPATLAPHGFTVAVPRAALDAFSGSASVAFETIPLLEQLLKEEAQELSTEYLPDTVDSAIISPPMPPKEVVLGDHIIDIVSELQSQARLGSETKRQPSPYPHENVVFHVGQLQAEALRKAEQPDRLMTLKEVADLYPDELTYDDVRRWHYSGLLEEQGRRWLARPGGRSIPLVSQLEVAYLKDNRPPRGPIEGFKQKMKEHIDRLKHELVKSRS